MKITRQDLASQPQPAPSSRPTFGHKARKLAGRAISLLKRRSFSAQAIVILTLMLVLAFCLGLAGQALGWYTPLLTVIQDPRSAWQRSRLPTLYLDVKFQDTQRLLAQRQYATLSGVHLARPGEVVTATVRTGKGSQGEHVVPVQIRLPQGVVEQSEPGWWGFEIQALDERRVSGWHHLKVSRLSLSQWGLVENLRYEGILSSPVQIVQLVLNGDRLGVYGAWAGLGPELIAQQGHPPGSIVYFDQALYWQDLQRRHEGGLAPTTVDLSNCQAAAVTALIDSPAAASALDRQAIEILSALQSGQRAPHEVLNVEQMGTLLALASLWQGTPLDNWTGLPFYLGPSSKQLEPIAMADLVPAEATEARPWSPTTTNQSGGKLHWPVCFDGPLIQAAYTRAVERISKPEYLQRLQDELGNEFEVAQLVLKARKASFPTSKPELTWDELAARQGRMAGWLEPTQAVLATWAVSPTAPLNPNAIVQVNLANLQHVPVEILGFDVGQSTFLPLDPAWIQDEEDIGQTLCGQVVYKTPSGQGTSEGLVLRAAGEGRLCPVRLALPYIKLFAAGRSPDEPLDMRVVTRLWGLERRQSAPVSFLGRR